MQEYQKFLIDKQLDDYSRNWNNFKFYMQLSELEWVVPLSSNLKIYIYCVSCKKSENLSTSQPHWDDLVKIQSNI